jgi:hypothetical protein
MASDEIKLGSQVVFEFLDSLANNSAIDSGTLATIRDLFHSGKLSKVQLLRSFEELRDDAGVPSSTTPKIEGGPSA